MKVKDYKSITELLQKKYNKKFYNFEDFEDCLKKLKKDFKDYQSYYKNNLKWNMKESFKEWLIRLIDNDSHLINKLKRKVG